MREKFTCKDCGDRYPSCHGKCEKYIREKAEHDERKAVEYQRRKVQNDIQNQRSVTIDRTCRKRTWYAKYKNHG